MFACWSPSRAVPASPYLTPSETTSVVEAGDGARGETLPSPLGMHAEGVEGDGGRRERAEGGRRRGWR